jgi:hypothetical protein
MMRVLPHYQTPKPLKQLVSGGQDFIMIQHLMQRVTLMLVQLLRRTQAEPAHVEAANTWCSTAPSTSSHRIWRWSRSTPGDQHTIEQRSAALIAERFDFSAEQGDVRATVLPACLEIAAIRLQRWRTQTTRPWPLRWMIAWRIRRLQQATHGHPAHPEILSYCPYRCACCVLVALRFAIVRCAAIGLQLAQFRSAAALAVGAMAP